MKNKQNVTYNWKTFSAAVRYSDAHALCPLTLPREVTTSSKKQRVIKQTYF